MSKTPYLFDTSAILTLLEDEEGAQRVETLLRREEVLFPFLALLETYYITLQGQTEDLADQRYALLKQLPKAILWNVDEPTLLTAGRFKAAHRLSLADALTPPLPPQHPPIPAHKAPEMEALHGPPQMATLPYK